MLYHITLGSMKCLLVLLLGSSWFKWWQCNLHCTSSLLVSIYLMDSVIYGCLQKQLFHQALQNVDFLMLSIIPFFLFISQYFIYLSQTGLKLWILLPLLLESCGCRYMSQWPIPNILWQRTFFHQLGMLICPKVYIVMGQAEQILSFCFLTTIFIEKCVLLLSSLGLSVMVFYFQCTNSEHLLSVH